MDHKGPFKRRRAGVRMLRKRDFTEAGGRCFDGGGRGCWPRAVGTTWKRQGAEGPSFQVIWGSMGILP